MKQTHGKRKASKLPPEDFISNIPDNVVNNILDRLPLQDAVKTSSLSKNWRVKWTMLSQLVFDESFYAYLVHTKHYKNYERLLLNLRGAISKFVLYIEEECNEEDISNWILFLSQKGVKDLTILKMEGELLDLPTYLISCLELKHLKLETCCFKPWASFHGFSNLLSLQLYNVELESGEFFESFTQCPSLEMLGITFCLGAIKLVEISKLTNLKQLSLSLYNIESMMITSFSGIFELLGFFPKLQELMLDFDDIKVTQDGVRKWSTTTFHCLKTLKLSSIDRGIMQVFAFDIIRSSPNLQTLEVTPSGPDINPPVCSSEVDYNTMGVLQLQSVVFSNLKGLSIELCLIESLLACSPFLKKLVIRTNPNLGSDEKLMFAMKLLELHLC